MRFSILFTVILPFFQLCDSTFSESHDDMLIQCRVNIKTLPKKREKHICEKENFDDDFDYQIANMEAPYSGELNWKHLSTIYKVLSTSIGQKFMCISFDKDQDQKLKFKLSFSHEKFTINAVSLTLDALFMFSLSQRFFLYSLALKMQILQKESSNHLWYLNLHLLLSFQLAM